MGQLSYGGFVMKEGEKSNGLGVVFFIETYPEWDNCDNPVEYAEKEGLEWLRILHHGEVKSDGRLKKWHYHTLIRTKNQSSVSAIAKNIGIDERWVRARDNWKETANYMCHTTKKAIEDGKKVFPMEELEGTLREKAIEYIKKVTGGNQTRKEDDNKRVLEILDFIESMDYLGSSVLLRWSVQNNCYSTLRRNSVLIRDCLREHNSNSAGRFQEVYFQARIREIENRLERVERLERGSRLVKEVTGLKKPVDMELLREIQQMA